MPKDENNKKEKGIFNGWTLESIVNSVIEEDINPPVSPTSPIKEAGQPKKFSVLKRALTSPVKEAGQPKQDLSSEEPPAKQRKNEQKPLATPSQLLVRSNWEKIPTTVQERIIEDLLSEKKKDYITGRLKPRDTQFVAQPSNYEPCSSSVLVSAPIESKTNNKQELQKDTETLSDQESSVAEPQYFG